MQKMDFLFWDACFLILRAVQLIFLMLEQKNASQL